MSGRFWLFFVSNFKAQTFFLKTKKRNKLMHNQAKNEKNKYASKSIFVFKKSLPLRSALNLV